MANNPTFYEIYETSDDLIKSLTDHGYSSIFDSIEGSAGYLKTFYSLMAGRKGNNQATVRQEYIERWKMRFEGILWQYGPAWMKNLNVQKEIRSLSMDELRKGTLMISSTALNPAQQPSGTFEGTDIPQVKTLDSQNTQQTRKGYVDAYNDLSIILENDVTEPFLRKFDALFKKILSAPPCEYEEDSDE